MGLVFSSVGFSGTPKDMGPPCGKRDPYYSLRALGILMGIVWEAYHKGVPLLGVPENPIDSWILSQQKKWTSASSVATSHEKPRNARCHAMRDACLLVEMGMKPDFRGGNGWQFVGPFGARLVFGA